MPRISFRLTSSLLLMIFLAGASIACLPASSPAAEESVEVEIDEADPSGVNAPEIESPEVEIGEVADDEAEILSLESQDEFSLEEIDEYALIAQMLALQPGDRIADVGAGRGEYSEDLARRVGPEGRVWATEVDEDDVEDLQDLFEEQTNVEVVLGDDQRTGLPEDCCDAILLRLVYHHFTDPPAMRASLRSALRPDARLVVIDISPQSDWRDLDGVPDRGGHGISTEDLIAEMTADGFEVVERFEEWPEDEDHYCVVFRRSGA